MARSGLAGPCNHVGHLEAAGPRGKRQEQGQKAPSQRELHTEWAVHLLRFSRFEEIHLSGLVIRLSVHRVMQGCDPRVSESDPTPHCLKLYPERDPFGSRNLFTLSL